MKKRKQKAIRAPRIPKAPDLVVSAQPNRRELKDPKARRLGMSAISATNSANAISANILSTTNTLNIPTNTADPDRHNTPSATLDNVKSIILSSPNLSTAYQTLRHHRIKNTTFNVNSIQSYPELIAALEAKAVQITLGANIITPDNITINHDVAINLNGYNIISEEANSGARVLDIRSGEVTLTGKGKIFAMGARSVAIRVFGAISIGMPSYTTLTIDEGISLFAPDSYGILVSPNLGVAYGLTINLSGEIIARDGIGLSSRIRGRNDNLPTINIRSGARITADETCGSALEAAGYAVWNIGAAKLTGATGTLLKSGQISFSHAEIIATGEAYAKNSAPTEILNTAESTDTPINSAIRIAPAVKHDLDIIVEGGSYLGEKSFAIAGDPSSLGSFVIKGGDFSGAIDVLHHGIETDIDIEEGSFSLHPALHLKALKPEIILLPEPEPEPYPKEIIEAMRPVEPQSPEETQTPEPAEAQHQQNLPQAKTQPPESPLKKLPMPPTYNEAEYAEKVAMKKALTEALSEMKNLKSSDYEVGFADLEAAIRDAEHLLSAKTITLAAIRDASAKLLTAFDNLEERDELSLTDDELDELFYHGAVLDELASAPQATNPKTRITATPQPQSATESQPGTATNTPAQTAVPQAAPASSPTPTPTKEATSQEPDLSALATIIGQISALNPADYTPDTYNILLSELAEVKTLLTNISVPQAASQPQTASDHQVTSTQSQASAMPTASTQSQIDTATQNLTTLVANLIPTRPQAPTKLAHYLIDEAVPVRNWSTGVTAIDETDPHLCLSRPLPKILRKKFNFDLSPISDFFKSFTAGLRAGFATYQKSRRTAKSQSN